MAGVTRHIYCACAAGVAAVLQSHKDDKGNDLAESWAASALPVIGGHSLGHSPPDVAWPKPPDVPDPCLQFTSARTEITGRETGKGNGIYTTTIHIKVEGLNILNWVTGDIDVRLIFTYHENPRPKRVDDKVDVDIQPANPFAGITIHGNPINPAGITLNSGIYNGAGQNFKKFRKDIDTLRPNKPNNDQMHHKHAHGEAAGHNHGLIFTALAEPPGSPLNYDPFDHARVDVPGFGSVYFAEWSAQPYRQDYALLRVKFTDAKDRLNPQSSFTGEIVIDEMENGETYP